MGSVIWKKYSFGMKQSLVIALAAMHDLEMLILDEPDKGLAPIGFDILSEMSMA